MSKNLINKEVFSQEPPERIKLLHAFEWWKIWKDFIFKAIELSKLSEQNGKW